jgi:O-antigen biosynthesis protein WbqP
VKRAFDFLLSLTLLIGLTIPMLMIAMAIKLTSSGPALYWSNRVGQQNALFRMPKFRTMRDPSRHLTPIGGFLRRMSLDEIPQLWSILRGHMSFVGPRAALFNQADLIELRTQKGIHRIVPGLTGWAQINGRDLISIPVKVDCDEFYLKNQSFWLDMKIILRTLLKVLMSDSVAH